MNNLQELMAQHKGKRSYATLADASGGLVSSKVLEGIVNRPPAGFPSTDTLKGIAVALNIPISDVVLAAGCSAGLDTHPMPDVHQLNEQVFYHQHHAATYKAQMAALHARIIPVKP